MILYASLLQSMKSVMGYVSLPRLAKVPFIRAYSRGRVEAHGGFKTFYSSTSASRLFSSSSGKPSQRVVSAWDKFRKGNIFLIGCPGAGKTTVGQLISQRLELPFLDMDDLLKNKWKMSVADKLRQLGGEGFIREEGNALLEYNGEGFVIALSGSNPLHAESMEHIQRLGVIVYLDVLDDDILRRLQFMKVDRIVGQEAGVAVSDILKHRKDFYEAVYDLRIICEGNERPESISSKVVVALKSFYEPSTYISTRGQDEKKFSQVVTEGIASDGGLFVPYIDFQHFSHNQLLRLVPLNYAERARRILEKLIHPRDVRPSDIKNYVLETYTEKAFGSDICRVLPISDRFQNKFIYELFHGPTASFKDYSLQLMPHFFHPAALESKHRYLILAATSGDTGSAVAHGFRALTSSGDVRVMVLYPEQGVSAIQKAQMLSAQSQYVETIGVAGDFDFCQSTVKNLLCDKQFTRSLIQDHQTKLNAANSINWTRIIAQIVYHISGYLELVRQNVIHVGHEIDICIPTGNFGNLLSAYYAKQMGIPIRKFICASNNNNVLTEFFNTGRYNMVGRRLVPTMSPAIDILKSSNLERYLFDILNRNPDKLNHLYEQLACDGTFQLPPLTFKRMKSEFFADWCTESFCSSTIHDTFKASGYLLDPHTAVAVAVGNKFHRKGVQPIPLLTYSTAHFAKCAADVLRSVTNQLIDGHLSDQISQLQSLNPKPEMHGHLKASIDAVPDKTNAVLDADSKSITKHILDFVQQS